MPETVAEPAPVLLRPTEPASTALAATVPPERSKAAPEVSVPFWMVPEVRESEPTVSAKPPRSKVPPETVNAPVSARTPAAPRVRVPLVTEVPPV